MSQRAWLQRPGIFRCVLVEIDYLDNGTLKTAHFARGNFRSAGSDTPAYTPYRDIIVGGLTFTSSIDAALFGHSPSGLGDIQLLAIPEAEMLLTKAVAGNPVRIYIGEESWPKAKFYQVATLISDGVTASGNNVRVLFRDFAADLNAPVLSKRTADGTLIPLCLGRVFNVTPVLVNESTHTYQFNREPSQAVTAVRFNGDTVKPSHYSVDLNKSEITFNVMPIGQITLDVDGANTGGWKQSARDIIQHLFTGAHIDADVPDYLLGSYTSDDSSKAQLLTNICTSIGAYWRFTVDGTLTVSRFVPPTGSASALITDDNNELNSRRISVTLPPSKEVTIGYKRNYTQISDVAGNVHEQNAKLAEHLQGESLLSLAESKPIATAYAKAAAIKADTLLANQADAATEANRRLTIGNKTRVIYETKQLAAGFELALGVEVQMTTPGLNGNTAVVTRKDYDLLNDAVTLELWQ